MKFSEILKNLREDNDETQQDLADFINVSLKTISRYENGTSEPTLSIATSIANHYDVSLDYLVSRKSKAVEKAEIKKIKEDLSVIINDYLKKNI